MFTPALVRCEIMRCLMRLHLTCVFVRFADCDTSLFSRVLTVVTYPSLPTRRYLPVVTYPLFTHRLPLLFGLFSYDELRLYAIVLVCILVSVMSSFPL